MSTRRDLLAFNVWIAMLATPAPMILRQVSQPTGEGNEPRDGKPAYVIGPSERACVLDLDLREVRVLLEEVGFERNPVAALKFRHDPTAEDNRGVPSVGSWRRIDPDDREMQYHLTLFELDDFIEVNAHYEYRWEPWAPDWDLERPKKHYYPDRHPEGVYDRQTAVEYVRDTFNDHGIVYRSPTRELGERR